MNRIYCLRAGWIGLWLFFVCSAMAQVAPGLIKSQAVDMTRALLKKDNKTFLTYMHPTVIQAGGGSAKVMQMMDTMQNTMIKFGAKVKKITIGNPSAIVKEKSSWQCTLPQTTILEFMGNEIEATTTLIGISEDQGKHWYFIDTSVYQEKQLKKIMPSISPTLVIPKMSPPKVRPMNQAIQ
jgi:hypothetical protein